MNLKEYFSDGWWREKEKFSKAIELFEYNNKISQELKLDHRMVSKWAKKHNLTYGRKPNNPLCYKGHDKTKTGSTSKGECLVCKNFRQTVEYISEENRKKKRERENIRRKNRTPEQISRDKENSMIRYKFRMNDPMYRMLIQARRRINYHEKRLKEPIKWLMDIEN